MRLKPETSNTRRSGFTTSMQDFRHRHTGSDERSGSALGASIPQQQIHPHSHQISPHPPSPSSSPVSFYYGLIRRRDSTRSFLIFSCLQNVRRTAFDQNQHPAHPVRLMHGATSNCAADQAALISAASRSSPGTSVPQCTKQGAH